MSAARPSTTTASMTKSGRDTGRLLISALQIQPGPPAGDGYSSRWRFGLVNELCHLRENFGNLHPAGAESRKKTAGQRCQAAEPWAPLIGVGKNIKHREKGYLETDATHQAVHQ